MFAGINLKKNAASNYSDLTALEKDKEITSMCWSSDDEDKVTKGPISPGLETSSWRLVGDSSLNTAETGVANQSPTSLQAGEIGP